MAIHKTLLTCLGLPLFLIAGAQAQNHAPPGCSPDLSPLYYNLCDRSGAWGIILEAVAGAGVVTTFVLTIILVASLPFVQDTKKRSLLGTQVFFLLGTLGLFCLVFACVVKPNFSTCASRRFLFGVLFAICFSCLVAHVFALNFLARKNHGPRGWVLFIVAVLLTLVEVIINTEWLIITLVRGGGEDGPLSNGSAGRAAASPCAIANMDFVMALIYVMLLLLGAFTGSWPTLCGRFKRWRKHGVFILLTTATSIAIWVVWIVMYTYGNQQHNSPTWDDPTLAIALAANAWAFVLFYVIPEVSQVTKASPEQSYQGDLYPTRGVGYETILKEQKGQSMFVENKAFSMDEPASGRLGDTLPHGPFFCSTLFAAGQGWSQAEWKVLEICLVFCLEVPEFHFLKDFFSYTYIIHEYSFTVKIENLQIKQNFFQLFPQFYPHSFLFHPQK